MRNESTPEAETDRAVSVCDCCRLVPISHLSLDLDVPVVGWPTWLEEQGIAVMPDDLGRPSIARSVFGALVREQTSMRKLLAERTALRAAEMAELERENRIPVGVPAQEGRSPYESMMTSEGRVLTPEMEFGGRERPNWVAHELDQSARQREAEAKERLADQLKEDLR
jgi:hypothetical protein